MGKRKRDDDPMGGEPIPTTILGENMFHCTGYYFCTKSNWNNSNYDSGNLVSINRFKDEDYNTDDFNNLTHEVDFFNKSKFESLRKEGDNKKGIKIFKRMCEIETRRLNEDVLMWLNNNVEDNSKDNEKGWCIGNDEYNSHGNDFSIWFYRRRDALNFIKTWSTYKKPTGSYNQDTYISKKLNLKTMTLQKVER